MPRGTSTHVISLDDAVVTWNMETRMIIDFSESSRIRASLAVNQSKIECQKSSWQRLTRANTRGRSARAAPAHAVLRSPLDPGVVMEALLRRALRLYRIWWFEPL